MSENRIRGGLIGPTFACILANQFKALKVGDRFWYEREDSTTGFTTGLFPIPCFVEELVTGAPEYTSECKLFTATDSNIPAISWQPVNMSHTIKT